VCVLEFPKKNRGILKNYRGLKCDELSMNLVDYAVRIIHAEAEKQISDV
jgi:hypothetical protein